ncbi:hypothetical protein ABZ951_26395 [Streptomyces sp. NPDC046215]|uniref:Secreted protein n=1 Tax=Streptomyces stramineus TaxID=173861 RepID=A0ABN0ZCP2_9ACTN
MITVIVITVLVIAAAALFFVVRGRTRGAGAPGLKRRFGPEYDRAVARHDGDIKGADRELNERVKRYGSFKEQPLSPEARRHYLSRWVTVQEQFVESPQKAVIEADALLAHLARDRGFPDGEYFEEQLAALSVHHAHYVHGYRSMHTAARGQSGTEEMREAMIGARSLFEALVTEQPGDPDRRRPRSPDARGHAPWAPNRRHAKGSGTR